MSMLRRTAPVTTAVALLVGACGSSSDGTAPTSGPSSAPTTAAPDLIRAALDEPHTSVVARAAVDRLEVFAEPGAPAPERVMPRQDPDYRGSDGEGVDQVLLVEDRAPGGWLEVLLPVRPNGTTGWVREDDVTLSRHEFAITVHLDDHRIVITRGGKVVHEAPIAVGTRDTPTPGGRFYLNALLRPPEPSSVYGAYAYALSGYSDTLTRFAGGDGVIGIHGTNDPSVIGTDVSHGCIRLRNEDIEVLVEMLPLGTPVEILA